MAVAADARRMSASSQTIIGSLPPSSSVTRVTLSAASFMIRLPVSVWPVNATLFTLGCDTSASPISEPEPCTMFSTPGGSPAELMISTAFCVASGVVDAGFSTTVQPAASAGQILFAMSVSGKFHGVIAATTPTGRRMVRPNFAGSSSGT